jgi:hypothetical protein
MSIIIGWLLLSYLIRNINCITLHTQTAQSYRRTIYCLNNMIMKIVFTQHSVQAKL